jgi:hypothetical protein
VCGKATMKTEMCQSRKKSNYIVFRNTLLNSVKWTFFFSVVKRVVDSSFA